jgi:hypothetical protein
VSVYGHVVLGAAVGALIPHPAAAFVAALTSHIPADLWSHHDVDVPWLEFLLAAAAILACGRVGGWQAPVLLGACGGALPDLEHLAVALGLWKKERLLFPTHGRRRIRHGDARPVGSVLAQAAFAALMLVWIAWAPALR